MYYSFLLKTIDIIAFIINNTIQYLQTHSSHSFIKLTTAVDIIIGCGYTL